MSKKIFSWILVIDSVLIFSRCKVPYNPPLKTSNVHYLVVEGFINGNGVTTIQLSRTRNITWGDTANIIIETGAKIQIEDQNNGVYPLTENGSGIYTGTYSFYSGNQYRLRVATADGKEYVSDLVPFKPSPPIDDITWDFKNGGVQIYANTHDPLNNTKYYRWAYGETWEFHSVYNSTLIWNSRLEKVVPRTEQVDTCWKTIHSSDIFVGSSARLTEDVINQAPLNFIAKNDDRISMLYSILVTQYGLDSTAYNYWSAMKSNTENIGSIFDAQPNNIRGNIHCTTDTSEIVIGFMSAGTTEQKRIFINHNQMPPDWIPTSLCYITNVPKDSIAYYLGGSLGLYPIDSIFTPGTRFAYTSSFINCVDCTFYGTNMKPSFWP
jgi:hypothetical protein